MSTNTPTPRTDAQADIEITVTTNSGKKETWSLDAVSKRFAREMETELRAELAKVTAERDEHKKSRDAAAWANQQLTHVLITAEAPEFSSAAHAQEWAMEVSQFRARVADLQQLNRELVAALQSAVKWLIMIDERRSDVPQWLRHDADPRPLRMKIEKLLKEARAERSNPGHAPLG